MTPRADDRRETHESRRPNAWEVVMLLVTLVTSLIAGSAKLALSDVSAQITSLDGRVGRIETVLMGSRH